MFLFFAHLISEVPVLVSLDLVTDEVDASPIVSIHLSHCMFWYPCTKCDDQSHKRSTIQMGNVYGYIARKCMSFSFRSQHVFHLELAFRGDSHTHIRVRYH
jgi:hypothetical protein